MRNSNNMHFESENPSSSRNRSFKSNGARNLDDNQSNLSKSDKDMGNDHQPIIAPGELREMVNKRSESANRKYRAYKHFIKYHNSINKVDISETKKETV